MPKAGERYSLEILQSRFADVPPPLFPDEALAEASRCLYCFDAPCTRACPTRIASLPSRAPKRRIGSFCSICPPGSPVHAESPLPMTLATSFDQRSPHKFSVTLALSAVPTSLQAMIGARLDGLPAEDKRAAQHASVVGMTFWSGAVDCNDVMCLPVFAGLPLDVQIAARWLLLVRL